MANSKLIELADPLPCRNQPQVIQQIQPTINLLKTLNSQHPEILKENSIDPQDYHDGLVFRSAIESIRGTYIASSTPGREQFVSDILSKMKSNGLIYDYDHLSSKERWDFEVYLDQAENHLCIIEVKGGEGNSINISARPRRVKEFGIWSHLDGSIQHPPSKAAKAIVRRITNELSARGKQVDVVFFRDVLCGTRARPCPKYANEESIIGDSTCPDIYLFPQRVPTIGDPNPPVHTLETLKLPLLILKHFGVSPANYEKHLWHINLGLKIVKKNSLSQLQRAYSISYLNEIIVQGRGKPFSIVEQ